MRRLTTARSGFARVTTMVVALAVAMAGDAALAQTVDESAGADLEIADFDPGAGADDAGTEVAPGADASPLRVTLAHEASYKVRRPETLVKNRSSVRAEYSRYFLKNFYVQLDAKATGFWKEDHRHDAEGSEVLVSQAYLQTSFGRTSIKAGFQTLPWGESIVAPITDEVSPRDNRELFNFNLEELRLAQPMVLVDQFTEAGQWSAFLVPRASFNENPAPGTAYFSDPLRYRAGLGGTDDLAEYGASWRKTFTGADMTFMAASLIDNNYALRMGGDGLVLRERRRFSLAGAAVNFALEQFVLRGEVAWKSPQTFNDHGLQPVRRDVVDAYLGVEYAPDSSLTLSLDAVNRHVVAWTTDIASAPRDSQSLLLSVTKLLLHDDLTINFLNLHRVPREGNVAMLITTYDWDDNLRFGVNVVYPYAQDTDGDLFAVRDQKQLALKIQYQF